MYLAQGWCTLNLALSALASIFDILIFLRFVQHLAQPVRPSPQNMRARHYWKYESLLRHFLLIFHLFSPNTRQGGSLVSRLNVVVSLFSRHNWLLAPKSLPPIWDLSLSKSPPCLCICLHLLGHQLRTIVVCPIRVYLNSPFADKNGDNRAFGSSLESCISARGMGGGLFIWWFEFFYILSDNPDTRHVSKSKLSRQEHHQVPIKFM